MFGTNENNLAAYKKQTYKYIPPTPPRNLIDSTTFTIDFVARKFIHIGLSPDNIFHLELHIITSSRHVVISPELLKRIYALMGHILSIILDTCDKSKNHVILEDSKTIITKMVYRGENMLVIESKNNIGCRILLSRTDLLTLQDLEMSIFEVAIRKNEISRPIVIEQIEEMASYFFTHVKSFNTREDMFQHVKNNKFNLISHIIPRNKHKYYDFIPELKLWAIEEIVQRWTMLIDAQNKRDEESQDVLDEINRTIIFSPPSTDHLIRAPMKKRKRPESAVDENDGLTTFTQLPSNDIGHQTSTDDNDHSSDDYADQSLPWGTKRKLFS